MRAYFRDGVLPPEGTVCEVETSIFGDKGVDQLLSDGMELVDEDRDLLRASYELSQAQIVPFMGLRW